MDKKIFPIKKGIRVQETRTDAFLFDQKDGLAGVQQTLDLMQSLKNAGKIDFVVRSLAQTITRNVPQKDFMGEIKALTDYVRDRIRYVRDVVGVETVQTPLKTLELGSGDCDDKSLLLAAMLESIGHKCRFQAVGFREGSVCHVFCEVLYDGQWLPLETTEPVEIGWVPPGIKERMYDSGNGGLSGFSDLKDKIKSKVKGDVTKPWDLKDKIKRDAAVAAADPVMAKIMKIKGLEIILYAIGYVFPPVAAAMAIIRTYVMPLYKAAVSIDAQVRASKHGVTPDGQDVYAALVEKKRILKELDNYVAMTERIISLDKLAKIGIGSATVMGGSVAYLLTRRKKHV